MNELLVFNEIPIPKYGDGNYQAKYANNVPIFH
jgi:hypothetical protein